MMSKCNIIQDLLPLYVENMVSDDTRQFVDEHLETCEVCKKALEQISINIPFEEETREIEPPATMLKRIGLDIKKKRVLTGVLSATLSAIALIVLFAHLTAKQYVPYKEAMTLMTIGKNNGVVNLTILGEYELAKREQGVYDISIYHTVWNKLFHQIRKQTITVNPNGEAVQTIYYASCGEQEDSVIYGEDPYAHGGVITLPRLFLSYYFMIALVAAFILLALCLLFRKKEKVKNKLVKILLVPIAYIISHIMIKGFYAVSYEADRDLCFILLLMIPTYLLVYTLCKRREQMRL